MKYNATSSGMNSCIHVPYLGASIQLCFLASNIISASIVVPSLHKIECGATFAAIVHLST